ncbi:hypothetical protein P148_SR1C00001G0633 [candidate division SR1 bacterium RAAC1_SR1_1]|nr:hypothetical protein P148_SR1C00001G0633 [candidate division SR1 bacterium RAAC1_SR1_1]
MHRSLDSILPQNERKEISGFFHTQNKELETLRNELINSIETNLLWSIIMETKEKGIEKFNEIIEKYHYNKHSRIASKIKRITKAILCFYKKEKTRKDTSDNIKHTFNEKLNKDKAEKIKQEKIKQERIKQERIKQERIKQERIEQKRVKQEKIIVGMHIKTYLDAKDNRPFGIFKTYFLENNKEGWNFHESADYAIKKVCEIYRRENNEEIQELFKDRARGNPYLKEEIEEDTNNLINK